MSLNCRQVQRQLSDYVDQQLTLQRKLAIDQHLGGCNFCQHALESLTETQKLLQYYVTPTLPDPDRVMVDLKSQIEKRGVDPPWQQVLGLNAGCRRTPIVALRYTGMLIVLLSVLLFLRGLMMGLPTDFTVANFGLDKVSSDTVPFSQPNSGRLLFTKADYSVENRRFERLISKTAHSAKQQMWGLTIIRENRDRLPLPFDQFDLFLEKSNIVDLNSREFTIDGRQPLTVLETDLTLNSEQVGADASALFTFSYSTPPRGRMTRINRLPEVVRDMVVPLKQDLIRDINLSLSGL
ncbi:hypothetical protein CMK18_16605 [Candidatus Poribacteria bacterium]|nr:hypothetical protein [Candidatus Poribacteria bacterium]